MSHPRIPRSGPARIDQDDARWYHLTPAGLALIAIVLSIALVLFGLAELLGALAAALAGAGGQP